MSLRSYLDKHLRHLFIFVVLVALLPACIIVVEEDDDRYDDDYYRRRWQLEVIVFSSGTYIPNDGDIYTLSFSTENALSGRADCVDFEGKYEVGRSSTLNINNLSAESAACGVDSIASMYIDELAQAKSYSGDSEELVIHLDGSNNLMRFKPD